MNAELLEKLGIDGSSGLKDVLEELEGKQFEILERLESVSDEKRREELDELNYQIDREIGNIKNEIKILSSALVMDDAQETEEVVIREQKKVSVENKLNAMKEKEAERRAKERKSAKTDDDTESGVSETVADNKTNELEMALRDYRNQNYSAAFPVLKKYAEAGDASIQYVVSQMYSAGDGAKQDDERAEFWLRSSADNGDVTAQFSYGMQLISKNNDNDKKSAEGLYYLGLAAEQNYKNGMIQFIESVNKGYGEVADANRAIKYCNQLIENAEDSFETNKYDEYMKGLKKSLKILKAKDRKVVLSTTFTILGSLFLIIGGVYFFGGVNDDLWTTNAFLKVLPDASTKLLLPIDELWKYLEKYVTVNSMLGIEILILSMVFFTAGNVEVKKKYSELIKKFSIAVAMGLSVWHVVNGVMYGVMKMTFTGEEFTLSCLIYVIIILAAIAIGACIGAILKKICGM